MAGTWPHMATHGHTWPHMARETRLGGGESCGREQGTRNKETRESAHFSQWLYRRRGHSLIVTYKCFV